MSYFDDEAEQTGDEKSDEECDSEVDADMSDVSDLVDHDCPEEDDMSLYAQVNNKMDRESDKMTASVIRNIKARAKKRAWKNMPGTILNMKMSMQVSHQKKEEN
jgi:hypothetical protein